MWLKIFSSFISVLIIFLITFLTFFSSGESNLDYYSKFKIPSNGVFSVIRDKNGDFTEVALKSDTQIYLERLDFLDKIFFNKKWSYKKTQISNNTSIKVWNGKYFMSFSFPKKYEVTWSWFKLNFVWPIKLYINTENQEKMDIFSFDNMVEMTLLGLEDSKEKNRVYIYPHMFYPFDLTLNKVSINADFNRTLQLNPWVWYVNQSLYSPEYKLDDYPNLDNYFFRSIISYFSAEFMTSKSDEAILKENFNNIKYDYIKKYFSIFINDNKKITYYKDMIYMSLLDVYMSPKNSNWIFEDIEGYYKNLKNLSEKDYTEMLKVLVYFKSKFLVDNKTESIETEQKFDNIFASVFSFQKQEWNYMLYYIFNQYDLWNKDSFFDWLTSFTDKYFINIWLKVQDDKILWSDDNKNIKLWYFIWFLDNIIKSYLVTNTNIDNIKWPFNILNKYSLLSVSVYLNWKTDKKKAIIVNNLELLKLLSEYIRNNFFQAELEKWVILVKKEWLKLDSKLLSQFEKDYNMLFNFFNNNKTVFDESEENDYLYLKDYEYISLNFVEYINALKNYDKYKLEKSNLYSIKTIGWEDVKRVVYTVGDINEYLAKFNWVNPGSIKIKTDESGNMYNVNMNIGWKEFYFELYPYNNFTIKEIYIDWVKKNITYSLNLVKEKMDDKYNYSSNSDEKNKSDFKNFFINTFLTVKTSSVTIYDNDRPSLPKESTEILVFKRDKLLKPRWEFTYIQEFTDIKSDNIIVNINNDKIDIKLKGIKSIFTYNLWRESNTYWAYVDSDYYIWNNEHYFSNMKVKLFKNVKNWNKVTENFWLWNWKEVIITWKIWINSYKEYMSSLLGYYNYLVFVHDTLSQKANNIEISVNSSKMIKYSFDYNWKNYELSLLKSSIVNFKRDWEKIIQSTFNYTDLPNRIDLLIK